MADTSYTPRDPTRWLVNWDWKGNSSGKPALPPALAQVPVTYVSMEEARAYCTHVGKRLPHVWEWQYAAGASDGRTYPWGGTWAGHAPETKSSHTLQGAANVTAFPKGCSPFGVCDLVGNVWQYTDEFQDEHSRFAVLKGGSNYCPADGCTSWYFPQAHELGQHMRVTMMDDAYDRAGTVGFRCVADVNTPPPSPSPSSPCDNSTSPLCAEVSYSSAGAGPTDLTTLGSVDWAHWGEGGSTAGSPAGTVSSTADTLSSTNLTRADRKESGTAPGEGVGLISDVRLVGSGGLQSFVSGQSFSWEDGLGPATVCGPGGRNSGVSTGVYTQGLHAGFEIEVGLGAGAADANASLVGAYTHTVTVFLGAWGGAGTLMATMGAVSVNATLPAPGKGITRDGTVTIHVDASSADGAASLTLKWVQDNEEGNITLEAVALAAA
jgi:hypothetical protein